MDGLSEIYADMELELIKHNLDPDLYPNVNWFKEGTEPTSIVAHRYYMSARGGGDVARYFLSVGSSFKMRLTSRRRPLLANPLPTTSTPIVPTSV